MNIINTLVDNPDILIGGKDRFQYKDVMIITKTKPLLSRYVRLFTDNHIPFKVEGDIDFNDCPALKDLVSVYKAVIHPENNFYLYEALISKVFNVTPELAMAIRNDISAVKKSGRFSSDIDEIQSAIDVLNRYETRSKTVTPSALMAEMIDELEIFAISGNHNLEYVYYMLELLREKESTGEIASGEDAVNYLSDLMIKNTKLERCASLEKNKNRIHIANLHKVKGLEAPVVILAGTIKSGKPYPPAKRVEYVDGYPKCYVLLIKNNDNTVYLTFKDRYHKTEKEIASEEAERVRHLYVAATRAKEMLIIGDEKPWEDLSSFASTDFFSKFKARENKPFVPEKVDGKTLYDNVESIVQDTSVSRMSSVEIHKPSDIEFERIVNEVETINTKRNPKLIGTLVHRLMEVIVSSKDTVDGNDLIRSMCRSIDVEDNYYSDILHEVYQRIHNGGYSQNNGFISDILNELLSADEVHCEVPFSYNNGKSSITTGIIDVLYRKADKWFVVDYKTNADGSNLDEEYRSQLEEYCKAVEKQNGIKPQRYIYHIETV